MKWTAAQLAGVRRVRRRFPPVAQARGAELLLVAAPPSTPEGVQLAAAPHAKATPTPPPCGAAGLYSPAEREAHDRNNRDQHWLALIDIGATRLERAGLSEQGEDLRKRARVLLGRERT